MVVSSQRDVCGRRNGTFVHRVVISSFLSHIFELLHRKLSKEVDRTFKPDTNSSRGSWTRQNISDHLSQKWVRITLKTTLATWEIVKPSACFQSCLHWIVKRERKWSLWTQSVPSSLLYLAPLGFTFRSFIRLFYFVQCFSTRKQLKLYQLLVLFLLTKLYRRFLCLSTLDDKPICNPHHSSIPEEQPWKSHNVDT